jgi:ribosomal protein L13
MANKYFTTSIQTSGKKIITINTKCVEPTPAELQAAQMYVNAGYEIRFKSEKRAAAARKRAKENGFGGKKAEASTEA